MKRPPRGNRRDLPEDLPGIKNPYVKFRPLHKPPVQSHPTTLWDYPSQHYGKGTQGSASYRGATPSHVIWNAIVKWSPEDAVVVDPFCGSGTTLDVCKDTGRQGVGYDLAPFRADIHKADARKLPQKSGTVDLVFMDPPYADNLHYSDDSKCIGKLEVEDGSWTEAMHKAVREAARILKPGGVLAFFVCDVLSKASPPPGQHRVFFPLGMMMAALAEDAGLVPVDHVAVVRHGKKLEEGAGKRHAEHEGFMLRGFSHLIAFAKPQTEGPVRG